MGWMALSTRRTRRWTRREYDRLVDSGIFRPGERLELLAGDLVVREPQGSLHATAIGRAEEALRACFGTGWVVRVQMPIALDDESEPEPDLAVVRGSLADFELAHPSTAVLIVEVADTSLADDRRDKSSLYARAGVPEYWIVNLVERVLEVHREPRPDPTVPLRAGYDAVQSWAPGAVVSPLARPEGHIHIADLFPRATYPR